MKQYSKEKHPVKRVSETQVNIATSYYIMQFAFYNESTSN